MQKSSSIIVRVDKGLKDSLQKKSNEVGVSLSEFIRMTLTEMNIEIIYKLLDKLFIHKTLAKTINFLYNKNSNNLNQLAKAANTANLSGKISDDIYLKYLEQLRLYTNEIHNLNSSIKFASGKYNVD